MVTYEQDKVWADQLRERFEMENHSFYGSFAVIPKQWWSIVLVDCEGHNRQSYFDALKFSADCFVVHDSQDLENQPPFVVGFDDFRFRYDFGDDPRTTLVSQVFDVRLCPA